MQLSDDCKNVARNYIYNETTEEPGDVEGLQQEVEELNSLVEDQDNEIQRLSNELNEMRDSIRESKQEEPAPVNTLLHLTCISLHLAKSRYTGYGCITGGIGQD